MAHPEYSITQTAATLAALLGVPAPADSAPFMPDVLDQAQKAFARPTCDRVFVYDPDAIARWIYDAQPQQLAPAAQAFDLLLPMRSVVPPVTPVCFASIYSGLSPDGHGIHRYEKPVLSVNTLFDTVPAAGRKAAIVSTAGDSISRLFLNRPVDYFIHPTVKECNDTALRLIREDAYDLIVLYNGNYDHWMHRTGPQGRRALRELADNAAVYAALKDQISQSWAKWDSTLVFAPDHGCHKVWGLFGTHGIDADCDMQTVQGYTFLPHTGG